MIADFASLLCMPLRHFLVFVLVALTAEEEADAPSRVDVEFVYAGAAGRGSGQIVDVASRPIAACLIAEVARLQMKADILWQLLCLLLVQFLSFDREQEASTDSSRRPPRQYWRGGLVPDRLGRWALQWVVIAI